MLPDRGCIRGEFDGGVVLVGGAVDEDVFLTIEQMVVGNETFLLIEKRPHESHVVEVAAVGAVQQRMGEILHGPDEIVVV